MALDSKQINFIKNKVEKFGSYELVKNYYSSDSLVCSFARKYAKKVYGERKRSKLKL